MSNCLFCKIVAESIPSETVYEDEHCRVFRDIQPKAPVHLLMVPKQHIENLDDLKPENATVASHMLLTIPKVAKQQGLDGGYRVVTNNGEGGGQEVYHLHFHILGGGELHGL